MLKKIGRFISTVYQEIDNLKKDSFMNTIEMNRKSFQKFLIIILLFLSGVITNFYAQEFSATVDKTTIGQSDRFQVYFTFSGDNVNTVSNFRAPDFQGFRVLSGPNQSQSMQIINGKVTGSVTYSFILQAQNTGEFTIGTASIDYRGKTFTSQPIKLKVEKGSLQNPPGSGYSNEEIANNVFILAEANKTRALLGEQITVTYKLYTKLNIASPQISKLPQYQGFWAEELDLKQTINVEIGMYKGERFRVATIKQAALFPTRTGKLSVTPFELNIPVIVKKRRTTNDIFDEFFGDSFFGRNETIEYQAKSNVITIDVEPLPVSNVPSSFNGAVGNFNFKAEVDKNKVSVNESITLRLTASGTGNIKLLQIPEPVLPTGFEKYEPKVYENINKGGVISGQKIVEYLIVPRTAGDKEIPSIEFSYFNPSTRRYATITTPAFNISVERGTGQYEPVAGSFSKEDVRLLSEDIRYIKTSAFKFEKKDEISLIKPWFWISIIFPLLVLLTTIGIRRRQDKLTGNTQLLKFRKAEKMARKRLKSAKHALDLGKLSEFYSELSLALYGYLEDKLGIQKSDFTLETALDKLQNRNVEMNLIDRVKGIAEKCEFVRFAPQGETSTSANEIYSEAVNVIVEVDSSLEKKR